MVANVWPALTCSPTVTPTVATVPETGKVADFCSASETDPVSVSSCCTSARVTEAVTSWSPPPDLVTA
ncbi:MAG: hypothetical protein JWN95_3621 [Frankiales bacterium]|nr:hypothetical protein [Frankiales bacterium]